MNGFVHSLESFGTVDGPGIRYVVFMQGCNLRCKYCHNPDTWTKGGNQMSESELMEKILRCKTFMTTSHGGITVSGGEPLLQMDFLIELFTHAKREGIHTAIDTSGDINIEDSETKEKLDKLLEVTDMFLLDIKHIDNEKYRELTGRSNETTLKFADYVSNKKNIDLWIRYVLVPGISDDISDVKKLKEFINTLSTVRKVEVLPYHRMGLPKWEMLGIENKLKDVKEPTPESVKEVKAILNENLNKAV